MQETEETWVQSLGQEDPLEEDMATHSSILAWRVPWSEGWWASVHSVTKSQTRLKRLSSSSGSKISKCWSLGHVRVFVTPWTVACQASLVRGILQARILEWVAMSSSRESS